MHNAHMFIYSLIRWWHVLFLYWWTIFMIGFYFFSTLFLWIGKKIVKKSVVFDWQLHCVTYNKIYIHAGLRHAFWSSKTFLYRFSIVPFVRRSLDCFVIVSISIKCKKDIKLQTAVEYWLTTVIFKDLTITTQTNFVFLFGIWFLCVFYCFRTKK